MIVNLYVISNISSVCILSVCLTCVLCVSYALILTQFHKHSNPYFKGKLESVVISSFLN
nr:MAG TPA: hypothetical protein [Caudoviricetes sp.]